LLHEDRDCGRGKPAILEILREVRAGETVLVTSHGEPVATIAPANATRAARAEAKRRLMEDLRAQPTLDLPRIARDELYDE
jgi:prevent-host-death family protein